MSKLIVTEFLTLDGMFEDPAPPTGYPSSDIGQFKYDELFASDALLLGRVTYEGFARYWPTMQGTSEFANRMNSLPKFVATTTPKGLEWNATALEGDVVTAVKQVKQQEGQNLLVYGSGTFAQTLLRHKLVDELRVLLYPLLRGNGRRFFSGEYHLPLKLASSREMGAGVLLLVYEPAET
ncbi:MAG: dihydrofolate reductase family protein [Trueperaceae bacterium]|nr:dihydrofolate reductase family protein [Trueperaceae bacterium]